MKLYVGNLSFKTTDDALREAFEPFGQVASAQVVMERETGRSRGFGFVEMPNDAEARKAIEAMHGKDMDGRNLTVNEAKPREAGGGGRGGGGGGWGGGVWHVLSPRQMGGWVCVRVQRTVTRLMSWPSSLIT